jgi:pimeloyl-ACP methyl ester carboxylesterase
MAPDKIKKLTFKKETSFFSNRDGWNLKIRRTTLPLKLSRKKRPILLIPGYGMNAFILGYHPTGLPMEDFLASEGFEVWSVNLRGQGDSEMIHGNNVITLRDLGVTDLSAAIHLILRKTRTRAKKVDLIGCSLGGTVAYVHLALVKKNHVGSVVAIGAPLRWEKTHPMLKLMALSPTLMRYLPITNVRNMAKKLAPIVMQFPSIIKLYLHPEFISQDHIDTMLNVVDDPNRFLNEEIARWVQNKDLIINRKNLTREMRKVKNAFLCLMGNEDGIVPADTALSAFEVMGSQKKEILVVGDDHVKFAHADMFISDYAQEMVFAPMATWLHKRYRATR